MDHGFGRVMEATTISFFPGLGNEISVSLWTPLFGSPIELFTDPDGGNIKLETHSFFYPIPISGLEVFCCNDSQTCNLVFTAFGI
jgi:hypothetical protein